MRASAVGSLGALGPAAAPAVPVLLKLTKSGEDYQRAQVLQAIGQIGPDAASAIPELAGLLSDPSEALCRAAAEALGGLEAITGQRLGKSPEPWRQWWASRE